MNIKLTILFLISTLFTFGQESFNLNNSHWYILSTSWDADEFKVASKEVFQTSSKMGRIDSTKNIYFKVNTTEPFILNNKLQKQFFVRQDSVTNNLYIRSFTDEANEFLLYDFNLNVGDTIQTAICSRLEAPLIVTNLKEEVYEGKVRKIIQAKVNANEKGKTFTLIEGIGTTNGFIVNLSEEIESGSILKCAHSENKLIFSQGDSCSDTPKLKPRPGKK
jgi:hypothetical protein